MTARFLLIRTRTRSHRRSNSENVVATVYENHFPGDSSSKRTDQEQGSITDFADVDRLAQRSPLAMQFDHVGNASHGGRGQRLDRARGDRVNTDAMRTEVIGEISN